MDESRPLECVGEIDMNAITRVIKTFSLWELLLGLRLTLRNLFVKKVTVQYPEERMEPAHRFRGMFRLDEERCIKCTICARDCPIDIIYIDWHQEVNPVTEKKEKLLDRFDIDVQRCMFCGLCEEGCPTDPKSIWLTSKTYELASYDRWTNLYVDMDELQDWQQWVLKDKEYRQCPFFFNRTLEQQDAFVCSWPGELDLGVFLFLALL